MEMDKLSRIGNGRNDFNKIGRSLRDQSQDEDEEDGEIKDGRLRVWNSSRIIRVSRASGGKDRHSKVLTAKGLRDRRVRLSVSTAIQFYDLQDRLGYDQPSKAVEWLIKSAADAISELPSLNSSFPETPKRPSNEKRQPSVASEPVLDPPEVESETEPNFQQQQPISLSKSACSSTSETSKGSVLSLSRSETRVKNRERARERVAKEKEEAFVAHQQSVNPNSQNSSFTELLTGGAGGGSRNSPPASTQQTPGGGLSFFHEPTRNLPSALMNYFGTGPFGPSSSRTHFSSGFSGQIHFGNLPQPHSMTMAPPFNVNGDHHPEQQQFSFLPDHLIPAEASAGNDFTISSGLSGYNRGTLQSNSPSPLPQLQRFSSPVDGSNLPLFIGTTASATAPVENHQFAAGYDGRLQLFYGDGCRHSDLKEKEKN